MNLKVSICCITFNHVQFIRECLDSFLMQKTDFLFEVLIHDDASTDGTAEIIKEYQQKYPDIIKPVFQTENQWSKGIRNIQSKYNFPRAKGKYIAMCEGDDYWTDTNKLQKQVDFLEKHKEYSAYSHNVRFIGLETRLFSTADSTVYSTSDLLLKRKFHTNSIMFRNDAKILEILTSAKPVLSGDRLLFIIISLLGEIYYDSTIMAVYRKNEGGISKNVKYNSLKKDFSIVDILYENKGEKSIDFTKLINFITYTCKDYATVPLSLNEKFDLLCKSLIYSIKYSKLNRGLINNIKFIFS